MSRFIVHFPTLALLVSLLLAVLIPIIDHHSADNMPGHKHLWFVSEHDHGHYHTHEGPRVEGPASLAIFDQESTAATISLSMSGRLLNREYCSFHPTSEFRVPVSKHWVLKELFGKPPEKPPPSFM
jgi:hypothetical protein